MMYGMQTGSVQPKKMKFGGLAITGERQLRRIVPFCWITRTAAAIMTVLAVVSLVTAITG